jgi:hypothetical protein
METSEVLLRGEVMSVSSETSETSETRGLHEPKSSVSPLLSAEGKDFLAGRIDARKYVEMARRDAAIQAQREFDVDVTRRSYRRTSSPILFLAALAYATFGIVSLVWDHVTVGIFAVITAAILGPVGGFFYSHYRQESVESGLHSLRRVLSHEHTHRPSG